MNRRHAKSRCLGFLLGLLLLGCHGLCPSRIDPSAFGQKDVGESESGAAAVFLLPADALAETFLLRQHVTIRWRGPEGEPLEASFDAAIQRQGAALLLVGLGPIGRVGFTLKLEAGQVAFENRTGRALPFEPARMLADVQRVYYPWLDTQPTCNDCVRTGKRGGFDIEEHVEQGRVTQRRFSPIDAASSAEENAARTFDVRYSGAPLMRGLGEDAFLRSARFGYEVELETLHLDWIN